MMPRTLEIDCDLRDLAIMRRQFIATSLEVLEDFRGRISESAYFYFRAQIGTGKTIQELQRELASCAYAEAEVQKEKNRAAAQKALAENRAMFQNMAAMEQQRLGVRYAAYLHAQGVIG